MLIGEIRPSAGGFGRWLMLICREFRLEALSRNQSAQKEEDIVGDITKEELKGIVFVTAHNSNELSDQVKLSIDAFDLETYRRLLRVALEKREQADRTGESGGGSVSAAHLREAIRNLEYILSH